MQISRHSLVWAIALMIWNGSCAPNEGTSTTNDQTKKEATALFSSYYEGDELAAILKLKHIFEQGLTANPGQRPAAFDYEQHALRMRLDFLNQETFEFFYPYNGDFRLSTYPDQVEQLSFLTNKCGFQVIETEEIIHHLCFNTDKRFFDYLEQLGKENAVIASFRDNYLNNKVIVQEDRKSMILNSVEELDWENPDHQLFYFLFHALVNEEHHTSKEAHRKQK